MFDKVKELELGNTYSFNVIYREGNCGHAAKLNLTPELITFKVISERKFDLSWDAKQAECEGNGGVFILKGLYCTFTKWSTISYDPPIQMHEAEFTVESLVFCPGGRPCDGVFSSMDIFSETINNWVGYTNTQEKILELHSQHKDIWDALIEFSTQANTNEYIGIRYNASYCQSPLSFESGFTFPPSLFYLFGLEENAADPFSTFQRIYNLLAFLTGTTPSIQKVITHFDPDRYGSQGTLYYSGIKASPTKPDELIMFPLAKDLRFNDRPLVPFPLSSFALYFDPNSELPDLLEKYVKYRAMGNVEDRLLGYFRLLEKHCYNKRYYLPEALFTRFSRLARGWVKANGLDKRQTKSFDSGLKRFNGQKYNTEKCVTDFFQSLPEQIKKGLDITTDILTEICKLRNDITHANKYQVDDRRLHLLTAHVHHLLVFALLDKFQIDLNEVGFLTGRLKHY